MMDSEVDQNISDHKSLLSDISVGFPFFSSQSAQTELTWLDTNPSTDIWKV
jgi:hypothetical protein